MEESKQTPRIIYIILLIILVIVVFAWGFRIFESMGTGGATATAQMENMLRSRTEYYATATAEINP